MSNGGVKAIVYSGAEVTVKEKKSKLIINKKFYLKKDSKLYSSKNSKIFDGEILKAENTKQGYLELSADINKQSLAKNFKESVRQVENLYYENCGTCHTAYEPLKYSSEEWKVMMQSMKFQSGLTDFENKQISRYVSLFSLDSRNK